MKIRISKTKWNQIGRFAGWVKTDEFIEKLMDPYNFENLQNMIALASELLVKNNIIDSEIEPVVSDFSLHNIEYRTTKKINDEKMLNINFVIESGSDWLFHLDDDFDEEQENTGFYIFLKIMLFDIKKNSEMELIEETYNFKNNSTPYDVAKYLSSNINGLKDSIKEENLKGK